MLFRSVWPVSLQNRLKMYTFLSSTMIQLQPVQPKSVTSGSKWFFISEKPELQLTVWFFAVQFGSVAVFVQLHEPDFQKLSRTHGITMSQCF